MKTNLNNLIISITAAGIFYCSCTKEEVTIADNDRSGPTTGLLKGAPENVKKLNGYYYTCNSAGHIVIKGSDRRIVSFAAFSDLGADLTHGYNAIIDIPEGKMNGEISVGEMFRDTFRLPRIPVPGPNVYYYLSRAVLDSFNRNCIWTSKGDIGIEARSDTLISVFPELDVSAKVYKYKSGEPFTIPCDNIFRNYDSAWICLIVSRTWGTEWARIGKYVNPEYKYITFSYDEIQQALPNSGYFTIAFHASNYYHAWRNGKLEYYQFSVKKRVYFESY